MKETFKDALVAHLLASGREEAPDVFRSRIEFHPWFFYVGGVAYIEHGHQYDPLCSTERVMAPLSPLDPRRISRGFSDILVRWVVRPTRGMTEYGHEHRGIVSYVAFAVRLGFGGLVNLAVAFFGAVREMVRFHHANLSANAEKLQEEHERRMGLLAEATRIGIDRLRALAALQSPPVTGSVRGILASVLLDRLALALGASLVLFVLAIVGLRTGHLAASAGAVITAWLVTNRYLSRMRKLDFGDDMAERAGTLAKLFPAAFVIMGHTHLPMRTPVNDGQATYINVGSWAEDEAGAEVSEEEPPRAPRTHLVIHVDEGQPRAEFLRWESEQGPKRFDA